MEHMYLFLMMKYYYMCVVHFLLYGVLTFVVQTRRVHSTRRGQNIGSVIGTETEFIIHHLETFTYISVFVQSLIWPAGRKKLVVTQSVSWYVSTSTVTRRLQVKE